MLHHTLLSVGGGSGGPGDLPPGAVARIAVGAVVGGSVGGLTAVFVVVLAIIIIVYKKKKQKQKQAGKEDGMLHF